VLSLDYFNISMTESEDGIDDQIIHVWPWDGRGTLWNGLACVFQVNQSLLITNNLASCRTHRQEESNHGLNFEWKSERYFFLVHMHIQTLFMMDIELGIPNFNLKF
jgi:hypothetical protein